MLLLLLLFIAIIAALLYFLHKRNKTQEQEKTADVKEKEGNFPWQVFLPPNHPKRKLKNKNHNRQRRENFLREHDLLPTKHNVSEEFKKLHQMVKKHQLGKQHFSSLDDVIQKVELWKKNKKTDKKESDKLLKKLKDLAKL